KSPAGRHPPRERQAGRRTRAKARRDANGPLIPDVRLSPTIRKADPPRPVAATQTSVSRLFDEAPKPCDRQLPGVSERAEHARRVDERRRLRGADGARIAAPRPIQG